MQNKINILCIIIIIILSISIFYFYMGASGLSKDLINYGKLTNSLNIERDFEIYEALQEDNLTKLRKNLKLNFMFHLKPIETDNIENMLDTKNIDRLCKKYNIVKTDFKKDYKQKYPSTIKDLNLFCTP